MCLDFSPGCCSGSHHSSHNATILACISTVTVQNLIYGCGNFPQTTAESSDTPSIHCTQCVQQSINMSFQLRSGLPRDPVQMGEVVQREYVLIGRASLYPRVNVANTVHLLKHHSYCLQSQNRGRKDRLPDHR